MTANTKSIAVVGGGLAGIAASLAIARKSSHKVTLYESRARLGGRTGSFRNGSPGSRTDDEDPIDYCQHVGMGCCTNLLQLIEWLEQQQDWKREKSLYFYGATGQFQKLSALPLVPAPMHLATWLLKWPNLYWYDRYCIARGMLEINKVSLNQQTNHQSALDWLQEHQQSEAAINHFWNTIIVSALGEELEHVDLASVAKVLQDGFLRHRDAFHLLIPQRPLEELFNKQALQQLRNSGVEVKLQEAIQRIDRESHGDFVLSSRTCSNRYDALIIAVPWHQLSKLESGSAIPEVAEAASSAATLPSSPISGVHSWWDRAWLPHEHATIVGRHCQWIFSQPTQHTKRTADASRPAHRHYYQIVISASRSLPKADPMTLRKLIVEDLAEVFPQSKEANLLELKSVTDPQAVFSVRPGQWSMRSCSDVADPTLAFAGDWTLTGWPATMEGAILSGFTAAEKILGGSVQIRAAQLA